MTHPDDDILDLAALWAPIGGPTPDRIRDLFHIEVDDYLRRLLNAIRFHRRRLPERTRADLEHVVRILDPHRTRQDAAHEHTPTTR
ncbi:hypothetical protein [Rhodococcus sp. LB1]|uniref:hypothetical protein n=1 Tax=Rhodococcus sp. LB1 TaxID=1807499 RepID=UPI00077A7A4D|nr:hypothetical protein [Rhodococcus sp. LB1]KXX59403.1 hypothetical protein AZG88_41540 [Rhodococcus sp. LB1]